jgi:hypothetical protein
MKESEKQRVENPHHEEELMRKMAKIAEIQKR